MTLTRAQTLPPGYVAQPVGGGERNGIKWELDRVYDPTGRLDRDQTYWEIRHVLADDPAPRSVAYAEVAPAGVTFAEFARLTTPLERVERWIAVRNDALHPPPALTHSRHGHPTTPRSHRRQAAPL